MSCNQSGFCAFGNSWWWIIVLVIIFVLSMGFPGYGGKKQKRLCFSYLGDNYFLLRFILGKDKARFKKGNQ